MKEIVIIEPLFIRGQSHSAGEVISVDSVTAEAAVGAGRARYAPGPPVLGPRPATADPDSPSDPADVESRDPVPETRDPEVATEPDPGQAKKAKKSAKKSAKKDATADE